MDRRHEKGKLYQEPKKLVKLDMARADPGAGGRGNGTVYHITPARAVEGVISFDIARDLTDPNAFIATEVFEDHQVRERQEPLPQVDAVMALLPVGRQATPEAMVYEASLSEPALPYGYSTRTKA